MYKLFYRIHASADKEPEEEGGIGDEVAAPEATGFAEKARKPFNSLSGLTPDA